MEEQAIISFQGKPGSKPTLFPDDFPSVWKRRLEEDFYLEFGPGTIDLDYAIRTCRDWSHGSGKKRVDWVAVIRNGVRRGWLRPQSYVHSGRPSQAVRGALQRLTNKRTKGVLDE